MKENTILANVHMLATDKASNLMIDSNGKLRYSGSFGFDLFDENNNHQHTNKQFLYFTTDEEIKEGDKVFRVNPDGKLVDGEILSATKVIIATQSHKGFTKIVATTNRELWDYQGDFDYYKHSIAKIDTTFLQSYVDSYNSGKKIEQVLLEQGNAFVAGNYENICAICKKNFRGTDKLGFVCPEHPLLKLNSDGSVVVHPIVEKTYTREELENAIVKAIVFPETFVTDIVYDKDKFSKEYPIQ